MRLCFLAAALGLVLTQAAAAGPTCALIDAEKLPHTALLEAKLLADPGTTWVERTNIDTVLKEQKLQAAFGPQGVGERVKLGQLLKADVLVLVRAVRNVPEPVLEVVVSETAGGLRLAIRAVPLTKNIADDVAGLLTAVREGIAKHGETVKDVVAVPPFVSQDLGYQFDHLKAVYAKLAESTALDRKGIVVVELAEAQAIVRELKLAAPGSAIRERPLPVFLIGEYRHDGKGKDRTVSIKLRAERGEKPIGKTEVGVIKPEAAPEVIRKWAAGVLDAAGAAPPPASDATAEAKRLGELSRVHKRLGNWPEALALIEASLLLDPKQPELNADAIEILPRWIDDVVRPAPHNLDRLRQGAEAHRRGLEHLETLVTSGVKLARHAPRPGPGAPSRQFASVITQQIGGPFTPPVAEIVLPLREEESAVYAKLVPIVARQGNLDEEVYYAHRVSRYAGSAVQEYALLERTLLGLKDLPGGKERMRAHLLSHHNLPRGPMFAAHREFLQRMEAAGDADMKAAVAEARKVADELERAEKDIASRLQKARAAQAAFDAARKADPNIGKPFSSTEPERLEAALKGSPFALIRLTAEPKEPEPQLSPDHLFPRLTQLRGILAAGPGIDVLWADGEFSDGTLYVMKEKGKLKRCYRLGGLGSKFTSVAFDGKYVWAAGERASTPPVLIVLDPVTERVAIITEKDGLPVARKGALPKPGDRMGYRVAALDAGRACVAGSFGQAWVAVATFDPAKGASVKVIHEARDAEEDRPDEWKKTTVAFMPWHMFTLRATAADGTTSTRVLITRVGRSPGMIQHPLLIDPDAATAEVMLDAVPGLNLYPVCGNGRSVYLAAGMGYRGPEAQDPRLLRIDYPGKVRDLGPALAAGNKPALHFDGQRLHIVRVAPELHPWEEFVPVKERWWPAGDPSDWWVADPDRKEMKKVAGDFKRVFAVGTSSHYGLVVLLNLRVETALCTVSLDASPTKP